MNFSFFPLFNIKRSICLCGEEEECRRIAGEGKERWGSVES